MPSPTLVQTVQVLAPDEAIPRASQGRWWAAHTRPRAEKVLAVRLSRLGIFHYLPLRESVARSRNTRRLSRSAVPVFTGYLFFIATEEQRYQAMTTNRIVRTLSVPNEDQFLQELRHVHTVLVSGAPFARYPRLAVGRWVRIVSGPLAGVEGVVIERRDSVRVVLNVHILGQSVSVETAADFVESIDPPSGS